MRVYCGNISDVPVHGATSAVMANCPNDPPVTCCATCTRRTKLATSEVARGALKGCVKKPSPGSTIHSCAATGAALPSWLQRPKPKLNPLFCCSPAGTSSRCSEPSRHANVTGVATCWPSTITSSPGGLVLTVTPLGVLPYKRLTASTSLAE